MDQQTVLLFVAVLVAPALFTLWILERRARVALRDNVRALERERAHFQDRVVARHSTHV